MTSDQQLRSGANESVFRDINEAIERGQWPGEKGGVAFRCECARLRCTELMRVTLADYEDVRSFPRRFIVAPGHEQPEVESVVEVREDYVVVEKRDEAGHLADLTDPRR